jgi:hypothetical protein
MRKKVILGQEILDDFFESIEAIEAVDSKISEMISYI